MYDARDEQTGGRPRLPLADVVYGATMKVYTTMSGRRATTEIRECETKGARREGAELQLGVPGATVRERLCAAHGIPDARPVPAARRAPGADPAAADELARHEARKHNRALYCLLIAFASPRRSELEALDWQHVELGRGVIRVPKGKTIACTMALHPVLRPWLEAMHGGSGPIVQLWSNMGRDLPRACERAGVPRCTANDLRRTFASWLVQAGVSLLIVSRLLGHKSTRMVDLVYGQLADATLASAIGRLPGAVTPV